MLKTLNSTEGLRVLMYARYSTDKQNEHSIDAQFGMLRDWLEKNGWRNCLITELYDKGISGAESSRPGIDELKNRIEGWQVDVIIAEDIARFYRDEIFFGLLVKLANDHNVRVITVNDSFDSTDEKSRLIYLIQATQHALSRQDTSRRIKRSKLELFKNGYVNGPVCPGYSRVPVNPVSEGLQKGPWKDVRDDSKTPIIQQIFERVARGDSLESVAEYATQAGMPKHKTHSRSQKWNTQNFYNFIRNPIYYGLERWRYKKVLKSETTGHSRPVRAEDDYVMYRDMPHLAHVSKALWDKANAVIANRCTHNNKKTGRDNPRFGVSLKNDPTRLGPKLKCWICGGTLRRRGPHIDGIYSPALPAVPDIHILTDHLGIKAHLSTQ